MADTNTILRELVAVKRAIAIVEQITGYEKYGDMGEVEIQNEAEDVFLRDEFDRIVNGLDDAKSRIEYLMLPISETGTLFRNSNGRYETEKGNEYTCGCRIEYLSVAEDEYEHTKWCRSSVEHDGNDYYIVGERNLSLDGLLVRVRG